MQVHGAGTLLQDRLDHALGDRRNLFGETRTWADDLARAGTGLDEAMMRMDEIHTYVVGATVDLTHGEKTPDRRMRALTRVPRASDSSSRTRRRQALKSQAIDSSNRSRSSSRS